MSERKFSQISEQYQSGHQEPTVLIRRSDETIQAAYLTGESHEGGHIVRFIDPADGLEKIKKIIPGTLADDVQSQLAETLSASRTVSTNSEVSVDTIPRELLVSQIEKVPKTIHSLGEVALKQEVILDNESSREAEISRDSKAAEARIAAVLGESNEVTNTLAETLLDGGDTPDAIRKALADKSNQELRAQVSSVLSRRMEELLVEGGHFHERVQSNNPNNLKAPEGNHGYEMQKYRSDEYVVLLALAKLDGSFDTARERNNFDDRDRNHASQGQHRQASDALLESFVRENEPAKPEREQQDDPAFIEAQKSIDTMIAELLPLVRINDEQLHEMEYMLQAEMLNPDVMDDRTDALVQYVHKMYEVIEGSISTINDIKSRIDDDTAENVKRRHVLESTEKTIRIGMDILSVDFSLQGVGVIDRKTQEARYDGNMQTEYRAVVQQTIGQLYEAQQRMIQVLEAAHI